MKVAVVGYGIIGRLHAAILHKRGTLSAVCDVDEAVLATAPDDVAHYTDYTDMLERESPDAVHICTPHYLHAAMVIEALDRGVHVLCEKPLCIRPEEIDEILEAEKRSTATLGVCLQNRYNGANQYAKAYLEDKKNVSGVGQVAWCRTAAYYASAAWRGKWATEGGGVLINQALHTLDLMQWLVGMPDELIAQTSCLTLADTIEVEDTASIVCRGKHEFTFLATTASSSDFPVTIQLKADGETVTVLPDRVIVGGESISFENGCFSLDRKACYGNGHEALIEDFYACIADGRRFAIDGEAGARVIRLILAAYESQGKPVHLST